ncbi:hypothetical protein [Corynebacterium argentoratense]|uniref:hypothetical protein n=1 Tax=Corynebacterium argentoratense TaxID=42817 RepID=UPI001F25DE75|nr:hypothetical protein [Corynebacterium argentoratense]MCF1693612.1 hypothetical protein [Corynebacterium argentoratense]MCF1734659.1 hypothetical protein [Corynebacterium argentoratense]
MRKTSLIAAALAATTVCSAATLAAPVHAVTEVAIPGDFSFVGTAQLLLALD